MTDRINRNQIRAHKQNIGVLQAHGILLSQIEKDRRKRLRAVEQELVDAFRFLGDFTMLIALIVAVTANTGIT